MPFSLHPALGQALMHAVTYPAATASVLSSGLNQNVLSRLTGFGSSSSGLQTAANRPLAADLYEDHFVLPGFRVLLLTNKRVAMVHAPGAADSAAPSCHLLKATALTLRRAVHHRLCGAAAISAEWRNYARDSGAGWKPVLDAALGWHAHSRAGLAPAAARAAP